VEGVSLVRASLSSPVVAELIGLLNAELLGLYPEEGATTFDLDAAEVEEGSGVFFLAMTGDDALGCGALRRLNGEEGEIKRMFVRPEARGRGVSRLVLGGLEEEARRLGLTRLLLETGDRLGAALGLYGAFGFTRCPCFGSYATKPLSVCMSKELEP